MCYVAASGFDIFYCKLTNSVLRYPCVRCNFHSVEIKTVISIGNILAKLFFLLQPLSTYQLELKSAVDRSVSEAKAWDLPKVSVKDFTRRRFTHKVDWDNLVILIYWWEHVTVVPTQTYAFELMIRKLQFICSTLYLYYCIKTDLRLVSALKHTYWLGPRLNSYFFLLP